LPKNQLVGRGPGGYGNLGFFLVSRLNAAHRSKTKKALLANKRNMVGLLLSQIRIVATVAWLQHSDSPSQLLRCGKELETGPALQQHWRFVVRSKDYSTVLSYYRTGVPLKFLLF